MNDFVNPNNRSVSLPPGCKDLIDVLQGRKAPVQEEAICTRNKPLPWINLKPTSEVVRQQRAQLPIEEVGRFVRMAFESPERDATLIATSPPGLCALFLKRWSQKPAHLYLMAPLEGQSGERLRRYLMNQVIPFTDGGQGKLNLFILEQTPNELASLEEFFVRLCRDIFIAASDGVAGIYISFYETAPIEHE